MVNLTPSSSANGVKSVFLNKKWLLNATIMDHKGIELPNHALLIEDERIAWYGPMTELPRKYQTGDILEEDCCGDLITPGLIDCHTHLVYGGCRANEFNKRLRGTSYAEIAEGGGGILSTVKKTRALSEEKLLEESLPRILAMRKEGVTTIEIKSGYGLDLKNELKMLRVARQLGKIAKVRVKTTFLGAHAIPPEYLGKRQAYIDFLCREVLPKVVDSGYADAVDVFCESIGFSIAEMEQLFRCAKELGLPIKCHAEQLSNMGASALAAECGALSCDHLEFLDEAGAHMMAKSNTVAVLLPGAYYFLQESKKPPIDMLRKAGIAMAIATDCNPGSSPTTSLPLMMNMACVLFGLTVAETWMAVTHHAARALGIAHQTGKIAVGMAADLVQWRLSDSALLCYHFGYPIPHRTMIAGEWIASWENVHGT